MNTTPDMWERLSDLLSDSDEKLPDSLNKAIYALRDGEARVIPNVQLTDAKAYEAHLTEAYQIIASISQWGADFEDMAHVYERAFDLAEKAAREAISEVRRLQTTIEN